MSQIIFYEALHGLCKLRADLEDADSILVDETPSEERRGSAIFYLFPSGLIIRHQLANLWADGPPYEEWKEVGLDQVSVSVKSEPAVTSNIGRDVVLNQYRSSSGRS